MNVFQNVAFALTRGRKRIPRNEVTEKVRRALTLVKLEGLGDRAATDCKHNVATLAKLCVKSH